MDDKAIDELLKTISRDNKMIRGVTPEEANAIHDAAERGHAGARELVTRAVVPMKWAEVNSEDADDEVDDEDVDDDDADDEDDDFDDEFDADDDVGDGDDEEDDDDEE